ncbi:MAG: hypothetical protein CML24_14590 [Rhizobiales bacterium]|nr:hypothetical protein [Hyphomicrobiales bacterium]|tara:strand:+ start:11046 stop:12629 length:1584 start_codon:yes stop_codon:yes gene_type:complete
MAVINNPVIAQAAQNLADIFRPPSGADLAGYANANATRQQADRLASLFADPNLPEWDKRAIAAGLYNPTQSFYAQDQNTATTMRGQDLGYQSSIDVANINNAGALERQNALPITVNENQTAFLPAQTQSATGLPEIMTGNINIAPGEVTHTADGGTIAGPVKPLTESEWDAAQRERLRMAGLLTDQDILDTIMGEQTPVQAVGADGRPVFMSPGAAVRSGAAPAPSGSDSSAAEEQIARLSQQFIDTGLTTDPAEARNLAIGIVDNRYVVSRHPVTGEAQILDVASQRPVAGGGATTPAAGGALDGSFSAVGDATDPTLDAIMRDEASSDSPFGTRFSASPESFGVGGALAGGVNTVFDAVGAGAPYPEVQQTQSDFAVLRESLLNDIGSAYNRQPPSWLLQNIQALTPRAGNVFEGAGTAQSKLTAIGRQLTDELRVAEETLRGELSPANRQEVETRVIGLRAAIGRVTDALQSFDSGGQAPTPPSPPSPPAPPSPGDAGAQEGATATNPATGERVIFRNGQWEPM